MTDFVRIDDVGSLDRLREAFVRYGSDLEAALVQARHEVERTLNYLGERYRHWKGEHDRWQAEAERCWRLLERCENGVCEGRWDRRTIHRGCVRFYEEWHSAEQRRRHAELCMEQVKGLIRSVEQARDAFERDASQIQANMRAEIPRAQQRLSRTAAQARALAAHRFAGSSLAPGGTVFREASIAASGTTDGIGRGASTRTEAPGPEPSWPVGAHAPGPGEGSSREGAPDAEAGEGSTRHSTQPEGAAVEPDREPMAGGAKERGF